LLIIGIPQDAEISGHLVWFLASGGPCFVSRVTCLEGPVLDS